MAKHEDASLAAAILALAEKLGTSQEKLNETLAALRESQTPREVNFGDTDYQARLRAETKVLKRPAFQNGYEVNPSGLSDEVIERLANLKPGSYIGGVVKVAVEGESIHLIYKNRTADQRMALNAKFSSFSDLVNKIWAEMHPQADAA
jgi:hypothetical protein